MKQQAVLQQFLNTNFQVLLNTQSLISKRQLLTICEADLQTEITATLKYFAAHNPKKVSVQDCEILSENDKYSYVYITYNLILEDDQEYPCVGTYMVGKQDKTYYIMAPSQITDDMKTQAATAYVQFMKTDAYKTYTKAYETFIKKNPGYEDKISEKAGV